jgi:hypothetical protein
MTEAAAFPECESAGKLQADQLCACVIRLYELITAPKQPTLYRAELWTLTGDKAKASSTAIYVAVKTADDRTLLASATGADCSVDGAAWTIYVHKSSHIVPLVVEAPGISKADCGGFLVRMWVKTYNIDEPWTIDTVRITLYFSDGTNLVAENVAVELLRDASTEFAAP